MIRYPVDPDALVTAVDELSETWRARAKARQAAINALGRFEEASSIWSEVKSVFIKLQFNKCVFCETKLERGRHERIAFDLEHFRPKSSVETWPKAGVHPVTYGFPTGSAGAGYFWLAYDLQNYAAACKACNTNLKLNYFPVAGKRAAYPAATDLIAEQAFLCYPLGMTDADPEGLIGFDATVAIPASTDRSERARGEIIIDFFDLNRREGLQIERAMMISMFGSALRAVTDSHATAADEMLATNITSSANPHANCLRSFADLWNTDETKARAVHASCQEIVASIS